VSWPWNCAGRWCGHCVIVYSVISGTVARQKSAPKSQKRVFCISILSTLLFIIIFINIVCILLISISNNKTFRKEFYLFKKLIIFKVFRLKKNLLLLHNIKSLKYLLL